VDESAVFHVCFVVVVDYLLCVVYVDVYSDIIKCKKLQTPPLNNDVLQPTTNELTFIIE
jgi:hypothetical protein